MFWQIYWPVFAAIVSAFGVSELFSMGLGYYLHRKQTKLRAEFEAKIASGEINPMEMMFGPDGPGGSGGPGGMPGMPPLPTTSGETPGANSIHGNYV